MGQLQHQANIILGFAKTWKNKKFPGHDDVWLAAQIQNQFHHFQQIIEGDVKHKQVNISLSQP